MLCNFSGYVSGIPELVYNPWTWTKFTNMIYCKYNIHVIMYKYGIHICHVHLYTVVESPAGIGFSYSDNPKADYETDDEKTAQDNNYHAVSVELV